MVNGQKPAPCSAFLCLVRDIQCISAPVTALRMLGGPGLTASRKTAQMLKSLISYRSWITSNLYGQLKVNEGLVLLNE
jgi:hypothetical protein